MALIVKQLIASEELQRPCRRAQKIQQPLEYVEESSFLPRDARATSTGNMYLFNFLGKKIVITSKQVRDLVISRQFRRLHNGLCPLWPQPDLRPNRQFATYQLKELRHTSIFFLIRNTNTSFTDLLQGLDRIPCLCE